MIPSSLAQQWPFLAVLAMAIVGLFGIVLKLNDSRIADLKASYDREIAALKASYEQQIAGLTGRVQSLEGQLAAMTQVAFSGTALAERAASVADQVAHATPAAEGAKPGALTQAARRIAGRRTGP